MIRSLVVGVVVLIATSCSGTPKGPAIAPSLDMYLKTEDGRQVRYDLASDGTLRFSGGNDILLDVWSWTGRVTRSEGDALKDIVSTPNWATQSGEQTGNAWVITLRDRDGRHNYQVNGGSPAIDSAWDILSEAGRARLQSDIDRLPRPDIDKLVERRTAAQIGSAE
jgi:hypothetical protein